MNYTLKKYRAVALLSVLTASVGSAEELFDDTLEAGSLNANGYYMYGGSGTASWTLTGVPGSSTLMDGQAMRRGGGTQQNVYALKQFSDVTFSNVGDSITVSLDMQAQGSTGILNVGFYDAPSITSNKLDGTYSLGSDGVYLYKDYGDDTSTRYRAGSDYSSFNQNLATSIFSIGDSLDHNITYTLTMTETGLEFSGSIAGSALETYTYAGITTASGFSVNTLRLAVGGGATVTYFDNIAVTAIPEPNAIWVGLTAGCVALVSMRRRRS